MDFNQSPDVTEEEKAYFRAKLELKLASLETDSSETVHKMQNGRTEFPDPTDRASFEFERNTTLRIRDRERKLIKKVQSAIKRLDNGEYNICEECEEQIGKSRLDARPVTNLCINCKEQQEQKENIQHF